MAILDYGLFRVHEDNRVIGICGYLIETTEGETVLIDTGFPPKYAAHPKAATEEDDLEVFGEVLSLGPENLAPAQLELLGVSPDDLTLMIQSHTHIDHMGYMGAFGDVPILIAATERALPHPLYWSGAAPQNWPKAHYITLDQDTALGPGFDILFVPGHAPGQLAFALDLPQTGKVVLTSDAISRDSEFDTGFAGAWDADQALTHARRLVRRAGQDRAKIIYGHSPEQWPELRKAPDWYD